MSAAKEDLQRSNKRRRSLPPRDRLHGLQLPFERVPERDILKHLDDPARELLVVCSNEARHCCALGRRPRAERRGDNNSSMPEGIHDLELPAAARLDWRNNDGRIVQVWRYFGDFAKYLDTRKLPGPSAKAIGLASDYMKPGVAPSIDHLWPDPPNQSIRCRVIRRITRTREEDNRTFGRGQESGLDVSARVWYQGY
jgi:hypothetical protein